METAFRSIHIADFGYEPLMTTDVLIACDITRSLTNMTHLAPRDQTRKNA